jgi:hypothetical protein
MHASNNETSAGHRCVRMRQVPAAESRFLHTTSASAAWRRRQAASASSALSQPVAAP